MPTTLAGRPPIKIGGEWRPRGLGPHDDVEVRVAYGIFSTPVLTEFLAGVSLREMRITAAGEGWRLMLKGERKGRYLVAFFYAPTWRDTLTAMATTLDSGNAIWYEDKYPPKP